MGKKPAPIADRIRVAMAGRWRADYWEIFEKTFPAAQFPRARRYSSNGGPAGAQMAFGAALRRMGWDWRWERDGLSRHVYRNGKD